MTTQTTDKATAIGIFNPAIKSNWPYIQHICPACRKVNGENSRGVTVQCDCGCDYKTPDAQQVIEFRNAEHAALVAVAEAAKELKRHEFNRNIGLMAKAGIKLESTLANLAKVQGSTK